MFFPLSISYIDFLASMCCTLVYTILVLRIQKYNKNSSIVEYSSK